MRDLNVRGCETEAIDRTFLCKRLAHQRGWCLSDGSLEEERHLDVWKTGLILAERESRSAAVRVESRVHSVWLLSCSQICSVSTETQVSMPS